MLGMLDQGGFVTSTSDDDDRSASSSFAFSTFLFISLYTLSIYVRYWAGNENALAGSPPIFISSSRALLSSDSFLFLLKTSVISG